MQEIPDSLALPRWQLRVLGGLWLSDGRQVLTRLPSRPITALLLRLALQPRRAQAREELVELLWPGVELAVGRNRLRQALSALKTLLEAPLDPPATVLQADRLSLRLLPGSLSLDVLQFEQAVQRGDFSRARELYGGELLPGHYDDWIVEERRRLEALLERCQAEAPGRPLWGQVLPDARPALHLPSLPASPHLPSYLTRYFDPGGQLERLRQQLTQQRLISLIGPGGIGKTRLSVELASGLRAAPLPGLCERVLFAALDHCQDAAALVEGLSRSLGLPLPRPDKALSPAALLEWLDGPPTLLVLDNLEQVIEPAAGLVQALLDGAPRLRIVLSSRRPLGLDGEQELVLDPLGWAGPAEQAEHGAAVALFVDRARTVRADFHLSRENREAVLALVAALQGLPLALEIAAVRVRAFSPAQMLAQWQQQSQADDSEPLPWLSRAQVRTSRHASMQAVVDWSWSLLDERQRVLLGALTVLDTEFCGEDALALMAGEAPALVMDTLAELVGHSLVYVLPQQAGAAQARYALLSVIRHQLRRHVTAVQQRAWRGRLRAEALDWLRGLGAYPPLERLNWRIGSMLSLLGSATGDGDGAQGLRLALALWPRWEADGVPASTLAALQRALAGGPELPSNLRGAAHDLLAALCFTSGQRDDALTHAEQALVLAGDSPGPRAAALVRRAWVLLASQRSEQGQQAWLEEAVVLARQAGDAAVEARAWQQQASIHAARARHAEAERDYARAQALWQALGHGRQAQARQRNRAQCLIELGRVEEAIAWIEDSQQLARAEGDWVGQMDAAYSLATAHEHRHRWAAALAAAQEAVRIAAQRQHLHGLGLILLLVLGRPLARLRRPEAAAQLCGYAAVFWRRHLGALSEADGRSLRRVRRLVQAQLGAPRCALLWARGERLSQTEAVALALAAAQA